MTQVLDKIGITVSDRSFSSLGLACSLSIDQIKIMRGMPIADYQSIGDCLSARSGNLVVLIRAGAASKERGSY
jgi:hypothetical protein